MEILGILTVLVIGGVFIYMVKCKISRTAKVRAAVSEKRMGPLPSPTVYKNSSIGSGNTGSKRRNIRNRNESRFTTTTEPTEFNDVENFAIAMATIQNTTIDTPTTHVIDTPASIDISCGCDSCFSD